MNLLHKSILILIAFSVFTFLILVTFTTNNLSNIDKPFYDLKEKWTYKLVEKEKWFYISSDLNNNSWSIFIQKINISDKILYNYWEVSSKQNWNKIEINITPWVYFFQLKEINTQYSINSKWFNIKNKWPWSFLINNLNPRKVIVFSIDTLIDLNLQNIKTGKDISTISLYPHMYLVFNPIKNIFVKNSDLLKVSQVFNLWYFNKEVTNSEDFLKLILLKNNKWEKVINNSLEFLKEEQEKRNEYINKYKKYVFWTIPWEKLIKIYNSILINPNKKNLYYKNIIIRETNSLLSSEKVEVIKITEIVDNLKKLHEINIESYNEVKDIILFQYSNVIITNQNSIIKINFTKLVNSIEWTNIKIAPKSLIYLEEIFSNYNSDSFYKNINNFTEKYFDDLKISIDWTDKRKWTISDLENVDYLLFFIENIMINTSTEQIKDISHIINIFNNYMTIANSFYSYSNENIKRIWLYINLDILNKFTKIINSYYFNERWDNEILTINDNAKLNKNDISLLEKNIKNIFIFYNNNQNVLDVNNSKKDKFLALKLYPNVKSKYKEYFYALNDYEEYLSIYDKSINNILTTKTINENNAQKIILSIDNAKKYLNIFNWVAINSKTNIKVMDYSYCENPNSNYENKEVETPYCYKIDNLKVGNNYISFLLYPFLNNKINNIQISWKKKPETSSYKLDEIEIRMEEKKKTIKENKELYEFENFLINTFWGNWNKIQNNIVIANEEEQLKQEDPFIRIFKRNKLLWELWDFSSLNWVIDILYDELKVSKKWDIYDIYIDSASFTTVINKKDHYIWLFSSKYNFSEKHSFIDPKIKMLNIKTKNDLLFGNYIYIKGDYKVTEIEDWLKTVIKSEKEIEVITNIIYTKLYNSKINIVFDKENDVVTLSTKYKNQKIEIKYKNQKIIDTKVNWNSIIEEPINYRDVDTILNKITN